MAGIVPLNSVLTGLGEDVTKKRGVGAPTGRDGREVQFQVDDGQIQWRYVGSPAWTELIALSELIGPDGLNGKTVLSGSSTPDDEGEDGDFYIRTSNWTIYGPKTAGAWGSAVSLMGPAGADGRTVLNGTTAPANGLGEDGDFYIRTSNWTIYGPKASGIWGSATSLFGPTGPAGNTVLSGSGVPSGGIGVDGDFYIRTSDWTIYGPKTSGAWGSPSSLIGDEGPPGASGAKTMTTHTAAFTVDAAKINSIMSCTGTYTIAFAQASSIGAGASFEIKNNGTGDLLIDPNLSETCDGLASFKMYPQEHRLFFCTGTAFISFVLNAYNKVFTSSDTFIKPPGYVSHEGDAWGAGASGARRASGPAGGGGGGYHLSFFLLDAAISATEAVTIGAGGAARATDMNGASGGNTTFGSLLTAYGGNPGTQAAPGSTVDGGQGAGAFASSGLPTRTVGGNALQGSDGGASGVAGQDPDTIHGGAAGGSVISGTSLQPAGKSQYGGAGGGAKGNSAADAGGNSLCGGDGGAGGMVDGTDGQAPGGGGGAGGSGVSGAGGRGELRIRGQV